MAVNSQREFASLDFFVIRRPNFPLDYFWEINKDGSTDPSLFINDFKRKISLNDDFLKAIYIASPPLHERTKKWIEGEHVSEEEKLIKTLYKYCSRICSRPTPYGLFSGVAIGTWADETKFEVDRKHDNVFLKLDLLVLNRLSEILLQNTQVKEKSLFFSNNSIFQVGDGYRYTEYVLNEGVREYFISYIGNSDNLKRILNLAGNGCYLHQIMEALVGCGMSEQESLQYVDDLIDLKIIQSEFEPSITDDNGIVFLIEKLQRVYPDFPMLPMLREILTLLESNDVSLNSLKRLENLLAEIFNNQSGDSFLQATLQQMYNHAEISNTIRTKIEKDLKLALPLLASGQKKDLNRFKKLFYEKYGDAEIPLSLALDGELGIDYGDAARLSSASILDDLNLQTTDTSKKTFGQWEQFLLDQYLKHLSEEKSCIELMKKDFEIFSTLPGLAASFYSIGNIILEPETDNLKYNLNYIGGSSAIPLLSRFSNSNTVLREKLSEIAVHEQNCYEEAVLAEIIFMPESRTGNVLSHPSFYKFEIPYISLPSVDENHQLPLSDLLISIRGGKEVVLSSNKLRRQVIPKLSNAHNYSTEIPVYRFLCDIQSEGKEINFSWNWSILENRPFLPRVVFNSIILSRKTWNIDISWLVKLDEFIRLYQLPRYIQLIDQDNEMLLDLEFHLSKSILIDELKKKGVVKVKEFMMPPSGCIVKEQNESFTNELIIPFKSSVFYPKAFVNGSDSAVKRKLFLGDEWLFVKIYSGPTILDNILIDIVYQSAEELLNDNTIDMWFFIRYQDPLPHIRLRFHKQNSAGFEKIVLENLTQRLAKLKSQSMIDRFVVDTYDRELERYGSGRIETAEKFFFIDSVYTVRIMSELNSIGHSEDRWIFGCLGVHMILDAFDVVDKQEIMTHCLESFLDGYQEKEGVRVQLNKKFRSVGHQIKKIVEQFETRSDDRIIMLFRAESLEIKRLLHESQIRFELFQIVSFLHMFCNRLFLGESLEQELVVYHGLSKFYTSTNAKNRNKKIEII